MNKTTEKIQEIMNRYKSNFNNMIEFADVLDPSYRFSRFIGVGIDEHDNLYLIMKKIDGNISYIDIDDVDEHVYFYEDDSFLDNYPNCGPEGTRLMLWPIFDVNGEHGYVNQD